MSSDSSLLKKGLAVLLSFKDMQKGQSISDIARGMNLPFSTASRIIKALEHEKFLERDADKLYQLGRNCYILGTLARQSGLLRRMSLPFMEELRTRFAETVILYVREGDIRVYHEQLVGPRTLKSTEVVGATAPLWVGSAGRCLLAYSAEEAILRILEDVRPLCINTITDKALFLERIQAIRKAGYDISISEREEGICSVSSPIMESAKKVVACITVTGPAHRFSHDVLDTMIPAIKTAATTISHSLQQAHPA